MAAPTGERGADRASGDALGGRSTTAHPGGAGTAPQRSGGKDKGPTGATGSDAPGERALWRSDRATDARSLADGGVDQTRDRDRDPTPLAAPVVKLLLSTLADAGCGAAHDALEKETGISIRSGAAAKLTAAVLDGRWDDALSCIGAVGTTGADASGTPAARSTNGSAPSDARGGPGAPARSCASNSNSRLHLAVLRQKFAELCEAGEVERAVRCLREEIAPLNAGDEPSAVAVRMTALSKMLLNAPAVQSRPKGESNGFATTGDRNGSALGKGKSASVASAVDPSRHTNGANGSHSSKEGENGTVSPASSSVPAAAAEGRRRLLDLLSAEMPDLIAVPRGRLIALLNQAAEWQRSDCSCRMDYVVRSRSADAGFGFGVAAAGEVDSGVAASERFELIWRDHRCGVASGVPRVEASQFSMTPTDEVWSVQFSFSGRSLAVGCKDGRVCVFSVSPRGELALERTLQSHQAAVVAVEWNVGDKQLLTCSNDGQFVVWNVATGTAQHSFQGGKSAAACKWTRAGDQVVAAVDRQLRLFTADGVLIWAAPSSRLIDVAVLAPGVFSDPTAESDPTERAEVTTVAGLCQDSYLHLFVIRVPTAHRTPAASSGGDPIVGTAAVSLALDTTVVSMSAANGGTQLILNASEGVCEYSVAGGAVTGAYRAPSATRLMIRCAAGGGGRDDYIAAGSEEGVVRVWNRKRSELVATLDAHCGPSNAVAWNPRVAGQLATVGDDGTVRVWMPASGRATATTNSAAGKLATPGSL